MKRRVDPEILDELLGHDPRALESRQDLLRLNQMMGHPGIVARALTRAGSVPGRLVELGAGDGRFALALARKLMPRWRDLRVVLVDRVNVVTDATLQSFRALDWTIQVVRADVLDWLEKNSEPAGCIVSNLFLHHFTEGDLRRLLAVVAKRTACFVACEPRRSPAILGFSQLVGLVGCNAVTRHDAVISVRAGFRGDELSALWPAKVGWLVREGRAGLFSHYFTATKSAVSS